MSVLLHIRESTILLTLGMTEVETCYAYGQGNFQDETFRQRVSISISISTFGLCVLLKLHLSHKEQPNLSAPQAKSLAHLFIVRFGSGQDYKVSS